MKHIIAVLLVGIVALQAQQNIVNLYPLKVDYEYPKGTYFKDIDGRLNKYHGTWRGKVDGNILTVVCKTEMYTHGDYYEDRLQCKMKLEAPDGTVIRDFLNAPSEGYSFGGAAQIDNKLTGGYGEPDNPDSSSYMEMWRGPTKEELTMYIYPREYWGLIGLERPTVDKDFVLPINKDIVLKAVFNTP